MQGIGHEYFFARGQLLKMESNHGVMIFEKSSTFWDTSDIAPIGSNLDLLKINNQTTVRSGDKVIIKGTRVNRVKGFGQIDNVTIYKNYFQPLGVDWEIGLLLILGILSLVSLIVYKKFSKSNVLILTPLIIVVIVFIIAGYFFLQNQQLQNVQKEISIMSPTTVAKSETANWKTYANNNLEFSFQYPSDWENIHLPNALEGFVTIGTRENVRTIINFNRHGVTSLPKGYSSITEWFNDFKNKKQKSLLPNDGYYYGPGSDNPNKWYMYFNMDNFKEATIDNISVIVTSNTDTGLLYVVVPARNYVYEIAINPISAYGNTTVDQILSAFKFLQ